MHDNSSSQLPIAGYNRHRLHVVIATLEFMTLYFPSSTIDHNRLLVLIMV